MGLFRKKPKPDRDPDLPLDVDQAARLRRLVREKFAARGIEVAVHAGHAVDDTGREFGFWNLAAMAANLPDREWSDLVAGHVDNVLNGMNTDGLEGFSEEQLTAATHLRLLDAESLGGRIEPLETLGGSIAVMLSVDRPQDILVTGAEKWAPYGGAARWRGIGARNLRKVLDDPDLTHERIAPEGTPLFHVVMGDSFYTGSTAYFIDDVVRRFAPDADPSRGVLLAVPFRHQLAFEVIRPSGASVTSFQRLFTFAINGYHDAPGPISPHVFWVRNGTWQQVTRLHDGEAILDVDADLAAALEITDQP